MNKSQHIEIKANIRDDIKDLTDTFHQRGRIQIPDYLEDASSKVIARSLADQQQWNLVWNNGGKHVDMDFDGVAQWTVAQRQQLHEIIISQAAEGFQYHFANVPIYDIYKENLLPDHFFNHVYEYFNSHAFLGLMREITGDERISFADMQATRYSKGHFLTEHDDQVDGKNRVAAYVLNLTEFWKIDWGGALVFPTDSAFCEAYYPKFNALNIFSVPQKHAVTMVSPFAYADRYSITGWLRY